MITLRAALASVPSGGRRVRRSAPTTRRSCGCYWIASGRASVAWTRARDAFELDELIHRYKRSARELWKFCGQTGSDWVTAVRTLEFWAQRGEVPDWWAAGEPRRRR